jgi:hypothetical protein
MTLVRAPKRTSVISIRSDRKMCGYAYEQSKHIKWSLCGSESKDARLLIAG